MTNCVRRILLASLCWFFSVVVASGTSSAGCLDWLCCKNWGRQTTAPAVVYPQTSSVAPSLYNTPQQPAQPTVVGYAPQRAYRTQWYRVPITNYRPVSTIDPTTGIPVTTLSPCIGYTWQARRVPANSWFPNQATIAPQPNLSYAPTVMPDAYANSFSPNTTFAAPANTCPHCSAPQVSSPYQVVPPTTTSPPMVAPTPASPQPSVVSPEAADNPPSLRPLMKDVEMPNVTVPNVTVPETPEIRYEPSIQSGAQSSSVRAPIRIQQRPLSSPAKKNNALQPVPDPDTLDNAPPALLDPNDRTARRNPQRTWAYVLISWPEKRSLSTETGLSISADEKVFRTPVVEAWDSSGWRSVSQ